MSDGRTSAPLVSVVIPNHNHTRYVTSAIRSVLAQTYRSFEIIVVDDGSTDGCDQAVAQFQSQVRYVYQDNQGLAGARNTGILNAKGRFVALLDADDEWCPAFLDRMTALARGDATASVFYCCARTIDEEGRELPQIFGGPPVVAPALYETLLRANFLIPSTVMFRRDAVLEAGLFDTTFKSAQGCEDWDLWLRLSKRQAFAGTAETLVRYRVHAGSMSAHPKGMQESARKVVEKHFGTDDGLLQTWSAAKRRAFGGLYRYLALTSVQRLDDWQAAALYLRRALEIDPSLVSDLGLFYDLVLGRQPAGFRGTTEHLQLDANAKILVDMVHRLAGAAHEPACASRSALLGIAYHAIGLVAYNTRNYTLGRASLVMALYHQPRLWRNRVVVGDLMKAVGLPLVRKARGVRAAS